MFHKFNTEYDGEVDVWSVLWRIWSKMRSYTVFWVYRVWLRWWGMVDWDGLGILIRIFSIDFSPCWIQPLAWFWTLQSSVESRLPSVTSYTGYQSESAPSSKLFFWCDIAWSALHQSTWWNCVVLSVQPPVDKASGLLPEATSSFLVSDSKHLVSELLLSRALIFGTHSHWTLDNLVTI